MQQLNYLQDQLPSSSPNRLLEALQDIVRNVRIESNFRINHPDYKPSELPTEMLTRFQQVPQNLQKKYLSLHLRNFLYGIHYSGSLRSTLALDTDLDSLALRKKLENNTFMGIDIEFFARLHESNCGKGYFDPGWRVLRQENDGSLAVKKGGLTLHIERNRHLQLTEQSSTVGDLVAIWTPRNRVQNGFYVAVGNAGQENHSNLDSHSGIVRIYFNLSFEGAAAVMKCITQQLNEIQLPFTFKVLYNPSDYGRFDSGVLYFNKSNYEGVRQVIQTVYKENKRYFQIEVPLFTKFIAPGLALAEEPNHKFSTQESFGMNRCQIVANGLLEAWQKGDNSPEARMTAIIQYFALLEIDLQRSYLNANSEDIYTQLSL
ncbi:MAG: T3SS effector HopA1 family protein [Nostoc sp. DedQUE12b]|uniref:T3SS effector HopA1 family protein n=1 Tax=Nostoc sp. DedQUE12b TaxID=3075398 RepID=UPI002AD2AC0A|nr:T3SS effector HopA1 family protein [Nostoc sp. DedQUE12b]MDZ8086885.1 T3SS effector HopA1 family protein [Nostoc sp. DedQUE12b]